MTVENIHQMALSECVCITNIYHITYDIGEYSPNAVRLCVFITNCYHVLYDNGEYSRVGNICMCLNYEQMPCYVWQWRVSTHGNISMCLHYEQLPCYVWHWRLFTRWQYQYVSALRTVTMLRMILEIIHQMPISVCVCITNRCPFTNDRGVYSSDFNISMLLH